jgi:crotonobetaine/carnitine-CoA ligase
LPSLTNSAKRKCETQDNSVAADALFQHCNSELAYFKAPGWIYFVDGLPTTGTQKIQKHDIFPDGTDPRTAPGAFDMRQRKKRTLKPVRD